MKRILLIFILLFQTIVTSQDYESRIFKSGGNTIKSFSGGNKVRGSISGTVAVDPPVGTGIDGTVGDGITDDTAAVQAWLDSGSTTLPVGNEVYRITQQLEIDQNGAQTVNFNGATITATTTQSIYAILIDKPDRALTTISNLLVDGDVKIRNGIRVDSPISANDVDIIDLYNNTGSVIAWRVGINTTSYGNFDWNGCDVTNLESVGTTVADPAGEGSVRAYDFQWTGSPLQSLVTINNFTWDGFFGSDGGPIRIDDYTGQNASALGHKTTISNGVNKNFTRRGIKMGMDNIEMYNINFEYIASGHPRFATYIEAAGLVGIRPIAGEFNGIIDNIVIDGCTFNGTTYPWAIIDKMDNLTISNSTFLTGSGIRIDNLSDSFMGDWVISNTTFSATSEIKDQNISSGAGTGQLAATTLTYDTGNSRTAASIITFDNGSAANPYTYITSEITPPAQQLLAFPSAEGFGRDTSGGRGGTVIHVTNLNNSGTGSFREAIETTGPRTIVFDVGGDIEISSNISAGIGNRLNDPATNFIPYGDLTIAGETAPFPGITLTTVGTDASDFGALLRVRASNVIIRYMTFRVNDNNISAMDALHVVNDFDTDSNVGGTFQMDLENIIIDHVSLSHGSDENFAMLGVDNSTVQNSMMARGQNSYNYLFGQRNYNHSFVGNYLSHQDQRNVLWGYGGQGESFEQINNVVYGYNEGNFVTYGHTADIIGNLYNAFPDDAPNTNTMSWRENGTNNAGAVATDGRVHFADNYLISTLGGNLYNADAITFNNATRGLTTSTITTIATTQQGIIDRVFQGTGPGNSLYQDSMDAALIADFNNQTGSFFAIDPTAKTLTTRPGSDDSDGDDMLDVAEIAIWGNITTTNNPIGDLDGDGYTDIEETHHFLAGDGIN